MGIYENYIRRGCRGRRPRRPGKNEKFTQNPVNEMINSYKHSNQICYIARVAEDVDPYE